jgi:hypothetical protein
MNKEMDKAAVVYQSCHPLFIIEIQALYAECLLELNLKILLRKTGPRLNFKTALIFMHIDAGLNINSRQDLYFIVFLVESQV